MFNLDFKFLNKDLYYWTSVENWFPVPGIYTVIWRNEYLNPEIHIWCQYMYSVIVHCKYTVDFKVSANYCLFYQEVLNVQNVLLDQLCDLLLSVPMPLSIFNYVHLQFFIENYLTICSQNWLIVASWRKSELIATASF